MNPYQVLGVSHHSSRADVDAAYEALCEKYHPRVGGDEWTFREIQAAYEKIGEYLQARGDTNAVVDSRQQTRIEQYRQRHDSLIQHHNNVLRKIREPSDPLAMTAVELTLGQAFDRRSAERFALRGNMLMTTEDGQSQIVSLYNISLEGLCVAAARLLLVGQSCMLVGELSSGLVIEFTAVVARVDSEESLLGLQITHIDNKSLRLLGQMIEAIKVSLANGNITPIRRLREPSSLAVGIGG